MPCIELKDSINILNIIKFTLKTECLCNIPKSEKEKSDRCANTCRRNKQTQN